MSTPPTKMERTFAFMQMLSNGIDPEPLIEAQISRNLEGLKERVKETVSSLSQDVDEKRALAELVMHEVKDFTLLETLEEQQKSLEDNKATLDSTWQQFMDTMQKTSDSLKEERSIKQRLIEQFREMKKMGNKEVSHFHHEEEFYLAVQAVSLRVKK